MKKLFLILHFCLIICIYANGQIDKTRAIPDWVNLNTTIESKGSYWILAYDQQTGFLSFSDNKGFDWINYRVGNWNYEKIILAEIKGIKVFIKTDRNLYRLNLRNLQWEMFFDKKHDKNHNLVNI